MARFIFITGGVVSSLGKGLMAASLAALLAGARLQGPHSQVRPLPQCRSGHDEPLSARRGLCDRRRGRNRSRPGSLRALHRRIRAAERQHHLGPHLSRHHRQGTARRLSRRHGAGDPARHRRDQGIRARRHGRPRFHPVRDRRHGRRHRIAAVHRGDPPAAERARTAADAVASTSRWCPTSPLRAS